MKQKLDEMIDRLCAQGEYMGLVVIAVQEGKTIYEKAAGCANREKGIPMAADTIFPLYSMSKPITAAAAMKLWEDGLLDMMEPVSRFLPSFAGQKVRTESGLVPAAREVTVQDLLNMTSGIPYPGELDTPEVDALFAEAMRKADGPNALTTREIADRLGRAPLCFHPGARWRYGASADVLGAVVEAVSGLSFGEYLKREFFVPLGMKDTGFFVPPEKLDRLAVIYRMPPRGETTVYDGRHLVILRYTEEPAFQSGGAGLVSTAQDYAAFCGMLLGEGEYSGVRILRPETVRYFRTGQLDERQKPTFDWPNMRGYTYGNLMRMLESPERQGVVCRPGVFGWDGWAGAYMEMHPQERLTLFILTAQVDRDNDWNRRKIRNCFYRAFLH